MAGRPVPRSAPPPAAAPHLVDRTLRSFTRLHTRRSARDDADAFAIEGVRNFVAARRLVRVGRRSGVPTVALSPEQFRRISSARRASGIAAIVRRRIEPIERVVAGADRSWLVLRTVRSPGNLGTLLRTSVATGGSGVILVGPAIDPFDPAVVRSSVGAIFSQTIVRTDLGRFSEHVRARDLRVVGVSPDAARSHFGLRSAHPTLLALGPEQAGLGPEIRALCRECVRIPMTDGVDSLNLSVAGSLLMYELYREVGGESPACDAAGVVRRGGDRRP